MKWYSLNSIIKQKVPGNKSKKMSKTARLKAIRHYWQKLEDT